MVLSYSLNFRRLAFHATSVWLFTFSDLKTILLPSTIFGIINGIAVSVGSRDTNSSVELPAPAQILRRTPLVLLWVWINLLPFNIDNQRQPQAIKEDALNKPWRSLPSKRLDPESARRLTFMLYPIAVTVSFFFGTLPQCLSLELLGYWYNDQHGSDSNPLIRNFINACGFVCFFSGAMQVAVGGQSAEATLWLHCRWFLMIAGIVFSTIQTQDMDDQRGDAARNRKTLPLVWGDVKARWSIAIAVLVWSFTTPWFWASSTVGYTAPVLLGFIVASRTLWMRNEEGDKTTFRTWNLWLVSICLLPLVRVLGIGV